MIQNALVLEGALVVDGSGSDPKVCDVSTEGSLIYAVGDCGSSVGNRIDLTGFTLLPGLIDAHTHLGLAKSFDQITPLAVVAARVFQNCALALDAGFTTVRDLGGVDGGIVQAIEQGLVRGPRVLPSGSTICQSGGHGDIRVPWRHPHEDPYGYPGLTVPPHPCDGPDAVRRSARTAFRRGARQLKICLTGGLVSLSDEIEDLQMSTEEIEAAVSEATSRSSYVTAHAHTSDGILKGLAGGIRCFEHGSFLNKSAAVALVAAKADLVPTLAATYLMKKHWAEWGMSASMIVRVDEVIEASKSSIQIASQTGVRLGLGSDLLGPNQSGRALELFLRASICGPMEAIVAATKTNAAICGLADCGQIKEGMRADLIAIDFNPLESPEFWADPTRVRLVIQGGQIVKNSSFVNL